MTTNPRILATLLGELSDQLMEWSSIASNTMKGLRLQQRFGAEGVERALQSGRLAIDQSERDQTALRELEIKAETFQGHVTEALKSSEAIRLEVLDAQALADGCKRRWEFELDLARKWLTRALSRLEIAKAELKRAQGIVLACETDVRRAQSALNNCRGDKNRNNCWSEELALDRAEKDLDRAIRYRTECENEVVAAEHEANLAQNRVKCCEQAVLISTSALEMAVESLTDAEHSCAEAARAQEFADAIKRVINNGKSVITNEASFSEQAESTAKAAEKLVIEGQHYFSVADSSETAAQQYVAEAKYVLEDKILSLWEIDRPTL